MRNDKSGAIESRLGAMPTSRSSVGMLTKREHGTRHRGARRCAGRRGAVLILVLACLAVALLVMASVVRLAVLQRSQLQLSARQVQARWLAESGLERAAARLAADPKYHGESWSLPASALGGRDGAVVLIEVETPAGQAARRLVRVRADYPDQLPLRVRHTRQWTIEIPKAGEKP